MFNQKLSLDECRSLMAQLAQVSFSSSMHTLFAQAHAGCSHGIWSFEPQGLGIADCLLSQLHHHTRTVHAAVPVRARPPIARARCGSGRVPKEVPPRPRPRALCAGQIRQGKAFMSRLCAEVQARILDLKLHHRAGLSRDMYSFFAGNIRLARALLNAAIPQARKLNGVPLSWADGRCRPFASAGEHRGIFGSSRKCYTCEAGRYVHITVWVWVCATKAYAHANVN